MGRSHQPGRSRGKNCKSFVNHFGIGPSLPVPVLDKSLVVGDIEPLAEVLVVGHIVMADGLDGGRRGKCSKSKPLQSQFLILPLNLLHEPPNSHHNSI